MGVWVCGCVGGCVGVWVGVWVGVCASVYAQTRLSQATGVNEATFLLGAE